MDWIHAAHAAATAAMGGLIWFVQVVHYPLLQRVPDAARVAYEREHVRRTGPIVAPLMGVEAATAAWLALRPPATIPVWAPWAGIGLLVVIWLSTAFLQVPQHRKLCAGPDRDAVRRLVRGNWVRTAAWTLRVPLAAWMSGAA